MVGGEVSAGGDAVQADGRLSALCGALLRISRSLELDTVLREVADGARALTGARYAAIATIGVGGAPHDFATSDMTAEEHRALEDWADGPRLFEHFRDLDGPLCIDDAPTYVRDLGFTPQWLPSNTFLGMPMRDGGEHVGNFYLVEKETGAAFTREDEEILALFASQAAAAIANARVHLGERRARSGLEALIETSPVGVVVLDVHSGKPVSLNREARRIVEPLRPAGRAVEDILDLMTCRLTDGREIALAEFPLAGVLSDAHAVRGEEVVLSTPDGGEVTTLVNATPIPAADGAPESVVVTMQDLAPIEELERTRAEFVDVVSHELRTPLTSIKGSTTAVLGASGRNAEAETREFVRVIDEQADRMLGLIADLLDAGRIRTGTLSVSPEPTEAGTLIEQARSAFQSGGGRHSVRVNLPPELPRVMADRQRIVQVLGSLLANAARHAPDTKPILVAVERQGVHVEFSVTDEGSGIAPERLAQLFRKYSAGAVEAGTAKPGATGLGLAICKGLVEAHGGRIRAESAGTGLGARFTFSLPVVVEEAAGSRGRDAEPRRGAGRILVVDDDPQALRFVRDTLSDAGFAPVVTGNHRELARVIRLEEPDLVLLDLVLSGIDGIELMEGVPELADLPVIFHLRLRPRRDHRPGAGCGRGGLCRQAFLVNRTDRPHPRRAAPPCAPRALHPRRIGHRLRPPPRASGRQPRDINRHGVQPAARSLPERGQGGQFRHSPAPSLAQPRRRLKKRPRLCQAATPKTRGRRDEPGMDLQHPRGRLPNAFARRRSSARLKPTRPQPRHGPAPVGATLVVADID